MSAKLSFLKKMSHRDSKLRICGHKCKRGNSLPLSILGLSPNPYRLLGCIPCGKWYHIVRNTPGIQWELTAKGESEVRQDCCGMFRLKFSQKGRKRKIINKKHTPAILKDGRGLVPRYGKALICNLPRKSGLFRAGIVDFATEFIILLLEFCDKSCYSKIMKTCRRERIIFPVSREAKIYAWFIWSFLFAT